MDNFYFHGTFFRPYACHLFYLLIVKKNSKILVTSIFGIRVGYSEIGSIQITTGLVSWFKIGIIRIMFSLF